MSNLPELPAEIIEKIISMVDDVDIRRYFGVYNKIDIRKYRMLETLIPEKIYYKWSCKEDCPEQCERHEFPKNFNPVLNPVFPNHYSAYNARVWIVENTKWKLVKRSPKSIGGYNVYIMKYNLPNINESDERRRYGRESDIVQIDICIYNEYKLDG